MENTMKDKVKVIDGIKKYRFLIIAFLIGIILLIMPVGKREEAIGTEEQRFAEILEQTNGVGSADVLISENGVVIVCEGAWNAETRLTVIEAAKAYTGFATDKIQVLKSEMED